jgi:hypothetical protein
MNFQIAHIFKSRQIKNLTEFMAGDNLIHTASTKVNTNGETTMTLECWKTIPMYIFQSMFYLIDCYK